MGMDNNGHRTSLVVGESMASGLGRTLRMSLPIKQRADLELFDGEPLFRGPRGADVSRSELIRHTKPQLRRFGTVAECHAQQRAMEAQGYVDAHLGLMLRPVNRTWLEQHHNTITQLGLNGLADKIVGGSSVTLPNGMKLGENNTTASLGDTNIIDGTPPSGAYQAFSTGYPQSSTDTASWRTFWDAGEATSSSLQEVVMKSADGSNDAINRVVFTLVNKGASDTYQITIQWSMSEG